MLINPENEEIIYLAFEKGKVHDFQLFKSSKIHLKTGAQLTAERGYQGLTKLHANSVLPKKSRACSRKKSVKNQSQSKNREINNIKLVVASKNFAKTLDPKKKALNLVATFVNFRIIKPR